MSASRLAALIVVVTVALSAAGEDPETLDRLLASAFGGLGEADEAPAFADADLQTTAFLAADPRVQDPFKQDTRFQGAQHVAVLVTWGYLRPRPDPTETVDWSGSISVEGAGLRVLRTLRFEEGDVVLRPRTDISVVEFESRTGPHADGLLLDVVIAPELNPSGDPPVLSFTTAKYTETIPIGPDRRHTRVVSVDDEGHVVAYAVIRPDTEGCAEGFVRGIWRTQSTVDGRDVGVIKGRFSAEDGRLRGHLRGIFGERQNGSKVWFAKVVDNEGAFLGVVAGRYGDGRFAGLFLGSDRKVRGVVRGRYVDTDREHDGGFLSRYSDRCDEDPREGFFIDDDEPDIRIDDDDR